MSECIVFNPEAQSQSVSESVSELAVRELELELGTQSVDI